MMFTAELLEPRRAHALRWAVAAGFVVAAHIGCAAVALMHWHEDDLEDAVAGATLVEMVPALAVPVDSPDVAHGPQVEEAMLTPPPSQETKEVVKEEQPKLEEAPLVPEPEVALPIQRPVEQETPKEEEPKEEIRQQSETLVSAAPLTMAPPKVEPAEEPVAQPAPAAGASSANVKRVQASWEKALVSHLNRFKRYPGSARARGAQGAVLVQFTIDRSGRVVTSRVIKPSGSSVLDDEALAVLQRASPLPGPPSELTGELFPLSLPIQFRIR